MESAFLPVGGETWDGEEIRVGAVGWEVSGAGLTVSFSLSYDLLLVQEAYQNAPLELSIADHSTLDWLAPHYFLGIYFH